MTEYVCGFMTDESDRVALIRKLRPEWQRGLLNGIGGHIEPNEPSAVAMQREFEEETGLHTSITQWWPFAILSGDNFVVHFFATKGNLDILKTKTDEEVVILPISEITVYNAIPNLTWLIPMSKTMLYEHATKFHIQEEY